jgi:hypothetical protein
VSEDARQKILVRRARFVAAALAGIGVVSCAGDQSPQACLSPPQPPPEADAGPTGPSGEPEADAGPGDAAEPPPHPCLSPVMPEDEK